jgi:hypothetical protein
MSNSGVRNAKHLETIFIFDGYSKYLKLVILEPNIEKIAICSICISQCAVKAWIIAN